MKKFKYKALDAKGVETSGEIEANSEAEATAQLRGMGLYPTEVREVDTPKPAGPRTLPLPGRTIKLPKAPVANIEAEPEEEGEKPAQILPGVSPYQKALLHQIHKAEERASMYGTLGMLIKTGVPFLMAIQATKETLSDPDIRKLADRIAKRVTEGESIGCAIHGYVPVYEVVIIEAGEEIGDLPNALFHLSEISYNETLEKDIEAVFSYLLSIMLDSHLPLLAGLEALSKHYENSTFGIVAEGLAGLVRNGYVFSEALAKYPDLFGSVFRANVKAGELGGILESTLMRHYELLSSSYRGHGLI